MSTQTHSTAAQHTAGPWDIETKGSKHFVAGADELTVAYLDRQGVNKTREESEANARLIAAAPELLAALERTTRLLALLNAPGTNDPIDAAVYSARAAIAKATGQA